MEMHCVVSWLEQSGAFSGRQIASRKLLLLFALLAPLAHLLVLGAFVFGETRPFTRTTISTPRGAQSLRGARVWLNSSSVRKLGLGFGSGWNPRPRPVDQPKEARGEIERDERIGWEI